MAGNALVPNFAGRQTQSWMRPVLSKGDAWSQGVHPAAHVNPGERVLGCPVLPFLQDGDKLGEPVAFHLGGLPERLELCYLCLPAFLFWGVREPGDQGGRQGSLEQLLTCGGGRGCRDMQESSEVAREKEADLVLPGSAPQPTVLALLPLAAKPDPTRARGTSAPLFARSLQGPGTSLVWLL